MEHNRTNRTEWRELISRTEGLTEDEKARRDEIIDYLVDALEAATRGGDYSTPIQYIAERYGGSDAGYDA